MELKKDSIQFYEYIEYHGYVLNGDNEITPIQENTDTRTIFIYLPNSLVG
jgi:hypothetical protein